ncbi:MAG: hypothetical protein Q9M31_06250 [Mariprofundus sp.]|nr:hypothetical protein [Mariprofundus sp.]
MKIQRNMPISGKSVKKQSASRTDGAFKALFDGEISEVKAPEEEAHSGQHANQEQAWKSLQESITMLDKAVECLTAGEAPTEELLENIEQLRTTLHQQLIPGSDQSLAQAETLLAVEAERIRSLRL